MGKCSRLVNKGVIDPLNLNKFAKPSKFLTPLQADRVLRNFTPTGQVLLKRGTHVASYGVFASRMKVWEGGMKLFGIKKCAPGESWGGRKDGKWLVHDHLPGHNNGLHSF
jgi:hypothetical protein